MIEVALNINSPKGPRRVALNGESMTIGRSPACVAHIINDGGVSRNHALIQRVRDEVRIVDQQSANGSYVNCELVPPEGTILVDGDEIFVGNHTTMTVSIREDDGAAAKHKTSTDGLPLSLLVAPIVALVVILLGAVIIQRVTGAGESHGREASDQIIREVADRKEAREVIAQPTATQPEPSPALNEEAILSSGSDVESNNLVPDSPDGTRKLYRRMTDDEKREFIKERAGRVAIMMGKRPYAFTPDALEYIKFWLDAFANRVGNSRTGLWGGDTRFILARGRVHAPVIIRAFKENRVPPVVGLYIPFIETEFTNIRTNNVAGAAGLFQFLGPTAEHYGVPSAERTDVAKMAPAAARYFRDNIMNFGDDSMSVALAIAGYNRAPESVKRDLRNVLNAENNADKERNFWTLIANQGKLDHFFQNENKNYVPRFFAAAILGENPLAFGIEMRPLSTYTRVEDQPANDAP
jgi:hypothetical protein